jgi:hypothetical protein
VPDDTETTAPKVRVLMRRKKDGLTRPVPQGAVEFRKKIGYEIVRESKSNPKEAS